MPRQSDETDDESDTVANEEEVANAFGTTSDGRSLRERGDLTDDDGDDVRQYSGEPVPTEDGYVIPQQSAVGSEQVVGGGEFPTDPGDVDNDQVNEDPVEAT